MYITIFFTLLLSPLSIFFYHKLHPSQYFKQVIFSNNLLVVFGSHPHKHCVVCLHLTVPAGSPSLPLVSFSKGVRCSNGFYCIFILMQQHFINFSTLGSLHQLCFIVYIFPWFHWSVSPLIERKSN